MTRIDKVTTKKGVFFRHTRVSPVRKSYNVYEISKALRIRWVCGIDCYKPSFAYGISNPFLMFGIESFYGRKVKVTPTAKKF